MGHAPFLRDLGVIMKKLFGKIRFTRKMLWIFIGICVVCNATGAAAVFIGRDKLIGPSYSEVNGLSCMEVETVDIHRKDQIWVRKYVTVDKADGVNRIRTALRVAKAVADSRKVDLVQVVVLDKNGPTDRAGIRGRAIGADVVYIRDAAALPSGVKRPLLTARYVDGMANSSGEFYGTPVSVPTSNAAAIMSKMTDKVDCEKPVVAALEEKAAKSEGGKPKKEGASHGKEGAAKEGAAKEGAGKEGAAKEGESAKGEAKPAEEHGAAASEEKPGMFASIKGMIFGAEEKPAGDAHGDGQPALPSVEGLKGDGKPAAEAHGETKAPVKKPEEASKMAPADAAKPVAVQPPVETVADLEPVEDKSVLSAVKSMVFGAKKTTSDANPAEGEKKSH